MKTRFVHLAAGVAAVVLAGCASVSVKEDKWSQEKLVLPKRVYVKNYDVPADVLAAAEAAAKAAMEESDMDD